MSTGNLFSVFHQIKDVLFPPDQLFVIYSRGIEKDMAEIITDVGIRYVVPMTLAASYFIERGGLV